MPPIQWIILISIFIWIYYSLHQSHGLESFNNTTPTLDVAVIVEPRLHPHLAPVIRNIMSNLPDSTKVQLFHGTNNLDFINQHLGKYISTGRLRLTNLGVQNLTINDYNKLLTSKTFWNSISGENILIFQTDSCLCRNGQYKLHKLLGYDYIGAPWKLSSLPIRTGGNGGLSFRKKSKMLEVCERYQSGNEDMFFSSQKSFRYPTRLLAKNLFIETIPGEQPFGVHKPWDYLTDVEMTKLSQDCPEIKTIFNK